MLDPLMLPPECPTCGRSFVSWPSVSRHLRLDHSPAEEKHEALTVAEILAARPDDDPPDRPKPAHAGPPVDGTSWNPLREYATQPPVLGMVVWLCALYGLSRLGFSVERLVAWSFVAAVVVGVVALRAWGRAELKRQEEIRRKNREL